MTLDEELAKVMGDGFKMVDVLKKAASEGCTQAEAIQALQKLYDAASLEGREKDEDLIVDLMDIAKNWCRPEDRIWPVDG